MSGWISVTRKHALGKHDLFKNEPFTEREAWTWLVANAAWEDTTHRVSGQRVNVPRGSFIGTLREMMTEWGWGSDTRVRKFLAKLEGEDMIERTAVGQKNARKTHVTICNYDDYQSGENKKTSKKRTEERAKNAVKEQINNKQPSEAKASSGRARGARLPADWVLPMDWGNWAVDEGWGEDVIRFEAEKFRDHWISQPGQKGTKLDWQATWRNWMRRIPKTANGVRNEPSRNSVSNGSANRSDPAVEQILKLTGLSGTSGDIGGRVGSHGEEAGSFRMGAGQGHVGPQQAFDRLDGRPTRLSVVGGARGLPSVGHG